MTITFRRFESLPRLAWCARLIKGHDTAEVLHGPWVETGDGFFCEGAWNSDFRSREFDRGIFMGSGGKVDNKGIIFSTPNHTMDRLFLLRKGKIAFVSNSLPFVLACANDSNDPSALMYSVKLAAVSHGIRGYARWLPTRHGNSVRIYYHCNLHIDSNLNVLEQPKDKIRDFRNFDDYKAFLLDQVAAIHANANDPGRKVTYRPIATISAGYDSPAASVLAKSVGCTEALTFTQARIFPTEDPLSDSGEPIAERLGMKTYAYDRLAYMNQKGFPEAEFYGWGAQESPWAKHLEARMVFTGHHGDRAWGVTVSRVNSDIERPGGPSGHNLEPFRLRVGWIHMPVAFLGITNHRSINRISNSQEMKPWILNNGYDRPIPRRLVEEAGVDRDMFGQRKKAAGVHLATEGLKVTLTPESLEDFNKYYDQHWNAWMNAKRQFLLLLKWLNRRHTEFCLNASDVLRRRLGIDVELNVLIPRDIRIGAFGELDKLSMLVHWSIEKLLPVYTVNAWTEEVPARLTKPVVQ